MHDNGTWQFEVIDINHFFQFHIYFTYDGYTVLEFWKRGENMSMFKNAVTYVLRKKVKTLIIFCVLLCMSTMTLSGVAVKKATDNAAKETFKTINSSFSMQINRRVNQGRSSVKLP